MIEALGKLVAVPLRSVWPHEAIDFTKWLAHTDNMALLADQLGLGELQVRGTEVQVGSFTIDILAEDADGHLVIVENQSGPTDHRHLGQILTYVAGQEGDVTVIWLAEHFREEHRAAIDWLNASTIEDYDFFAVEVEALRIGASLPAPRFNIIAKPNHWSRGVNRATQQIGGAMDERNKFYVNYWAQFAAFLEDRHSRFRVRRQFKDYYCTFRIGSAGVHLGAQAGRRDKLMGVELYISRADSKATYRALEAQKADIQKTFGEDLLDWQELPDKIASRVLLQKAADPSNEADHQQQFEWLVNNLERFQTAFADRIKALDIDQGADTGV
jgi:hypothetical protein